MTSTIGRLYSRVIKVLTEENFEVNEEEGRSGFSEELFKEIETKIRIKKYIIEEQVIANLLRPPSKGRVLYVSPTLFKIFVTTALEI